MTYDNREALAELLAHTHRQIPSPTPSMEAAVNENEVEFYIQKPNMDQIGSMSVGKEAQEQWGVFVPKSAKNAAEGSIRVRQIIKADEEPVYELTGKEFLPNGTKNEYDVEANADLFKFFRMIANDGMKKDRYFLPVEVNGTNLTLEVDVPYEKTGVSEWIKVDLEFPEGFGSIPDRSALEKLIPFSYEGALVLVTPSDKAEKNEVATQGHEIARRIMVIQNVMV